MNLSQLSPGESARIAFFKSKSKLIPRLIDMGISQNSPITCLFNSLSGNMKAYRIGNSTIALRREDARFIYIFNNEVLS